MMFWALSILFSMYTSSILLRKSYLRETSIGWLLAIWALPYFGSIIFLTMVVRRKAPNKEHDQEKLCCHKTLPYSQRIIEKMGIDSGFLPYDNLEDAIILRDDEFFPELLKQIDQAEKSIWICTFILKGDAKESMMTHLYDAHDRGVEIHLLVDRMGSGLLFNLASRREYQSMPFNTMIFRESLWSSLVYVEKRLHSKIAVFDSETVITGSHNIRDEIKLDAKGFARNLSLLITGSVVSQFEAVFNELVRQATGHTLVGELKLQKDKDAPIECSARVTHSNPLAQSFKYNDYLNGLFFSATKRMYVWMPYLIPSGTLRASIINAHRTGVDVKVLIPVRTDSRLVDNAHQLVLNELTDHGVPCSVSIGAFDHSKIIVIDDICVVGSTNLDHRSLYRNYEANIEINNRAFSNGLSDIFLDEFHASKKVECTHPTVKRNIINQITSLIATLY